MSLPLLRKTLSFLPLDGQIALASTCSKILHRTDASGGLIVHSMVSLSSFLHVLESCLGMPLTFRVVKWDTGETITPVLRLRLRPLLSLTTIEKFVIVPAWFQHHANVKQLEAFVLNTLKQMLVLGVNIRILKWREELFGGLAAVVAWQSTIARLACLSAQVTVRFVVGCLDDGSNHDTAGDDHDDRDADILDFGSTLVSLDSTLDTYPNLTVSLALKAPEAERLLQALSLRPHLRTTRLTVWVVGKLTRFTVREILAIMETCPGIVSWTGLEGSMEHKSFEAEVQGCIDCWIARLASAHPLRNLALLSSDTCGLKLTSDRVLGVFVGHRRMTVDMRGCSWFRTLRIRCSIEEATMLPPSSQGINLKNCPSNLLIENTVDSAEVAFSGRMHSIRLDKVLLRPAEGAVLILERGQFLLS